METILDMICAKCGSNIAQEIRDETLIQKSLGVLQEDGVYAFFLYLKSQKKQHADNMAKKAYEFLNQDGVLNSVFGTEPNELKAIRDKLVDKLDQLLFAKQLLERTLIYARYHAKALDNPTQQTSTVEGGD